MTRPLVEVTARDRAGSIIYREGDHSHRFDWELGGRDVVAIIYVPSADDWDARIPWAAGRRGEVLHALAHEVRRQKCRGCRIEMFERWIHLSEPPPLPARIAGALRRFVASFRDS